MSRSKQQPQKARVNEVPAPTADVTEEAIREAAFRKWEEAGKPDGDGVEFWLQAERELSEGGSAV